MHVYTTRGGHDARLGGFYYCLPVGIITNLDGIYISQDIYFQLSDKRVSASHAIWAVWFSHSFFHKPPPSVHSRRSTSMRLIHHVRGVWEPVERMDVGLILVGFNSIPPGNPGGWLICMGGHDASFHSSRKYFKWNGHLTQKRKAGKSRPAPLSWLLQTSKPRYRSFYANNTDTTLHY